MTMRTRIALLLAVPTLALAACGGDSDEDKIKDIVNDGNENAVTICENATDNFLKSNNFTREQCKQGAAEAEKTDKDKKPEDLKIDVDGDKATATFKDAEGNGRKVSFVKDGDDWKVDQVENG